MGNIAQRVEEAERLLWQKILQGMPRTDVSGSRRAS